jgi:hypothetical protein
MARWRFAVTVLARRDGEMHIGEVAALAPTHAWSAPTEVPASADWASAADSALSAPIEALSLPTLVPDPTGQPPSTTMTETPTGAALHTNRTDAPRCK